MTIFWINPDGSINRSTADEDDGPNGCTAIDVEPVHGKQIWDGTQWNEPPITWDEIRAERVPLLDAADIEINKRMDTAGNASAWRAYRQELRDITMAFTAPDLVVWPTPPS